jgi:DNA-binding transcriptional ArsR family regulator
MTDPAKPAELLVIRDRETLKVLSNRLRTEIMQQLDSPKTVTEIAKALGLPRTKLYYHTNLLEKHGLIRMVDSHVVSGIIERVYQVTAYRLGIDRTLLSGGSEEGIDEVLFCLFDGPREEVRRSIKAGLLTFRETADSPERELVQAPETHILTPAQFDTYRERLFAIVTEMGEHAREQEAAAEGTRSIGLSVALFPMAERPLDEEEDKENE